MSRPIAESLSLLSETLGNCKTNLKEKEVADVDNIKISDVDEKIAEIQAGGGGSDYSGLYSEVIEKVEVRQPGKTFTEVKFGEKVDATSYSVNQIEVQVTLKSNNYFSCFIFSDYYGSTMNSVNNHNDNIVTKTVNIDEYGGTTLCGILSGYGEKLISFFFFVKEPYLAG